MITCWFGLWWNGVPAMGWRLPTLPVTSRASPMQCCTLQLPLQLLLTNGYSSDDILAPISAAHSSACDQAGIRHATYSRFTGLDMLQEVIYY